MALAAAAPADQRSTATAAWCVVILGYALFRTLRPLRYLDDLESALLLIVEIAIHYAAVAATGFWDSPLVFSLVTAVMITGFAGGFAVALAVSAVSIVAVGVPDLLIDRSFHRGDAQLAVQLVLVALVGGYARRIAGDADRQQSLAIDRLGRLADANSLLFSLHRVAQSLPVSLDLDETLESTMNRLRDLFDYDAAAILLVDDTDRRWTVVRREGTHLPAKLTRDELPPPLTRALAAGLLIQEPNLLSRGGPGLAPRMYSGLYAVLPARGTVVGLVSLEHSEADHFTRRDAELLNGFVEPAALAIDNARWFSRLRTVGAEEERGRIARDLHDRIGQSLAYLAFELDRIVKSEQRGDNVAASLENLRNDVRGVVTQVRDTLYDLRTDVSEGQDLVTALQLYLDRVKHRSGINVTLRSEDTGRLPLPQEREMFRIAQEAMVNVERHANASQVSASWWCDGRSAVLEVADDGQGFPLGKAGRLDSYGILGMRERAASIGATLEIDSAPGSGTRIRCVLGEAKTRRTTLGLRSRS